MATDFVVEPFSASVTADDGDAVVTVLGEVDMATADQLRAAVTEAMTTWGGTVVVDLSGVTFLDSQGIRALLLVHKACDIDAAQLSIRSPSRRCDGSSS